MQPEPHTPLALPPPIADYFAADAVDAEAVARLFTPDAVVIDERRELRGRAAIRLWKAESSAKYRYTSEPLSVTASGAELTVIARVTGSFPGSPIELAYQFTCAGEQISRLEIGI